MAWMICGTVPDASFPLTGGRWRLDGGFLHAEGGGIAPLSVQRGTPALLGTALLTCETLGVEPPTALLAGDTGNGDGSRKLYSSLAASPSLSGVRGITFHYLFPNLDGHNRVLMALEETDPKPVLVADAGFMYVAKMSGYADAYDLFTPDAGDFWRCSSGLDRSERSLLLCLGNGQRDVQGGEPGPVEGQGDLVPGVIDQV